MALTRKIPGLRGAGPTGGPGSQQSAPRVVFVRHGVRLRTGGLTKAWLGRISLFEAAGWSVHVALIGNTPEIDETLRVLRAEHRLADSVVVHHFSGEQDRRPRLTALRAPRTRGAGHTEAWLDRVASADGALVFADSPGGYTVLANMRNPRVARVYVVHLAHLAAEAGLRASPEEIANGPMTKRFSTLSDATMRAASRIVVLTDAQKRDFALRWGKDLPVEVIPHCSDRVEVPSDVRHDPRLVVGMGRLGYHKRWDDAIRVMARVVQEVPDAQLMIYGVGDDLDRLRAVTEQLGMSRSVTFAGYTTSPLQVMASAACVISTSRREAMGLTLLESLSVGTPVVVSDIRYGPREIVRDGVDGFVVPSQDITAAAAAVLRLLTEPGLREQMSQSAREVSARFSREAHDRAWLALGHDLYERRAEPASPIRARRA